MPPQQSSFSSMEEGSLWSAQERTAVARMEQYVNNSQVWKLEVGRRCEAYFEERDKGRKFSVLEKKGEHPVASKWRWDGSQKQRRSEKEIDWKENRSPEVGDRRKWLAAYADVAKGMQYLGES